MDHGTAAENGFLDPIPRPGRALRLGARQPRLARSPSATWPGSAERPRPGRRTSGDRRRAALRGHRATRSSPPTARSRRAATRRSGWPGARLASALRDQRAAGAPVDIAVAHEPGRRPAETDGEVPLVLAGHIHHEDDGGHAVRHPAAGRGLHRRQRTARRRGRVPATRSRRRSSTSTGTRTASRPGTRSTWAVWG